MTNSRPVPRNYVWGIMLIETTTIVVVNWAEIWMMGISHINIQWQKRFLSEIQFSSIVYFSSMTWGWGLARKNALTPKRTRSLTPEDEERLRTRTRRDWTIDINTEKESIRSIFATNFSAFLKILCKLNVGGYKTKEQLRQTADATFSLTTSCKCASDTGTCRPTWIQTRHRARIVSHYKGWRRCRDIEWVRCRKGLRCRLLFWYVRSHFWLISRFARCICMNMQVYR